MKDFLKTHFPNAVGVYRALKKRLIPGDERMTAVFSEICQSNAWLGAESISGPGSDSVNTATIKREIPVLLGQLGVKSMLDAPCGDLNWMKDVGLSLERYIGADVVPEVIDRNQKSHARANSEFKVLDITRSRLPRVDLIFCRDCLVHLSYEQIGAALKRFQESGSRYLLTTTFTNPRVNTDMHTGGWRPLNLEKAPFNFPAPLHVINEQYVGDNGIYTDKSLGLWELSGLDVAAVSRRLRQG